MTWERFRLLVSRYPLSLPHVVHGVSPSPSHLVQVGDGCRAIEVELVLPGAARTAVLTQKDLARVIGGTEGTIIVENVVKVPQGIQGSG